MGYIHADGNMVLDKICKTKERSFRADEITGDRDRGKLYGRTSCIDLCGVTREIHRLKK